MDNNGMYDSLLEKVRHFVALYEKVKAEKAELEQKIVNAQKQISFLQMALQGWSGYPLHIGSYSIGCLYQGIGYE